MHRLLARPAPTACWRRSGGGRPTAAAVADANAPNPARHAAPSVLQSTRRLLYANRRVRAAAELPTAPDATPSTGGVYAAEPLDSGTAKHVLSAFVADEAGIINRVAGVFARRGANIESLAVGLNLDKALFTIVVTGSDAVVANLVKQTAKLVKVRYVEDISRAPRVERELVLVKVAAPPGPARAQVLQLADVFRARAVDVGPASVTLCAAGDTGKTAAFQAALAPYDTLQIARTGRVALKRGASLLEMGGWGDSAGWPPAGGGGGAAAAASAAQATASADDVVGVYGDGAAADDGAGAVRLDAPAYADAGDDGVDEHTLSVLVADVPGVLNQVTGVLARRGVNVQSLAVGPAESPGESRITAVMPGSVEGASKVVKQLQKIVYVTRVEDLSTAPVVARELMLVKVAASPADRRPLADLAAIFRGTICDVSATTLTIELVGREAKMRALQALLEPYGVLEIARTGRVALARDSGVDSRALARTKSERRVML